MRKDESGRKKKCECNRRWGRKKTDINDDNIDNILETFSIVIKKLKFHSDKDDNDNWKILWMW